MLKVPTIELFVVFVLAAAVLALVGRRVRLPAIVAYLVAGLALGPLSGVVAPIGETKDAAHLMGQVGIVMLMFVVGLELSLDRIRDVGKVAVAAGLGQVVFTAIGGTGIAWLLDYPMIEAAIIGIALTFSSTVIVVKVLDDKRELDTLYGRIAVGIFLVQDLVVIVALTILAGLAAAGGDVSLGSVTGSVVWAFAAMLGLMTGSVVASRYLLPRPFGWVAGSGSALVVWSLAWCFALVALATTVGLSAEIGGLLAGFSLAQIDVAEDIRRRVHPLMSVFLIVFFVALGAEMPVGEAQQHLGAAVVLSLFVLLGNPLVFLWIIAAGGFSARTAFQAGVTVAQISEFSLLFVAMSIQAGLVDSSILSLVGVVGVVTMVGSVYLILYNHQLFAWLDARGVFPWLGVSRRTEDEEAPHEAPLSGHVVVVGMNALGRAIVIALAARGERVLAIDTDPRKLAELPAKTMIGDIDQRATLEAARGAEARLWVSALRVDDTNQLLVWRARRMGVPVVVHGADEEAVALAMRLGPELVLDSKRAAGARLLARAEELIGTST